MRRAIIFTTAFVAVIFLVASATIINIPDDYPNIQQGINASTDGDTVLVHPGTYVENINFNGHNIVLGSLFLTTGDISYIAWTVIDGDWWDPVIIFENGEDSTAVVCGFTIQNGFAWYRGGGGIYCKYASPIVRHCLIESCVAVENGGGIYCENSSILVESCMIKENRAGDLPATTGTSGGGICLVDDYGSIIRYNIIMHNHSSTFSRTFGVSSGGGIYLSGNSNSQIINNLICSNSASCWAEWYAYSRGGGIFCSASDAIIRNNTIVDNSVSSTGGYEIEASGGGFSEQGSVINTIIWGNTAFENPNVSGSPSITYSCIEGGWEGEGNIYCDPLFCDPENGNFYLAENSCCVGAGENGEDIGAYGAGCEPTDVIDEDIALPWEYTVCQNYPNPFNAFTVIQYNLPATSDVTIEIFDILGRKVETLIQEEQNAGYHQAVWDASDHSSGMYFYRILAGEYAETRKMVLLK